MITTFEPLTEHKPEAQKSSAILTNPVTNTFDFVMDRKTRPGVSESLTLEDRRELVKTRLNNPDYFAHAKAVYAAGGGAEKIQQVCGKSLSYAEKVHAAFKRACK